MNWESKGGSHSCSFDIDWLRDHDYTTPLVHKERVKDQIPLIAVSIIPPLICVKQWKGLLYIAGHPELYKKNPYVFIVLVALLETTDTELANMFHCIVRLWRDCVVNCFI